MTTTHATHASEGGHWYDPKTCRLVETVTYANGKVGPPTLTHARKLGLYCGTTKIIACGQKEQLESWKRRQVLMAALTLPRDIDESDEAFCDRVLSDAERQAADAAQRGTAIHAVVQDYYVTGEEPADETLRAHVRGVAACVHATFGANPWMAEKCAVHPMGYGTKVDLCAPSWVLDFKTKDFTMAEAADLKVYDDHAMQLSAGIHAMSEQHPGEFHSRNLRAAIVYVSRTVPGLAHPVECPTDHLDRGWGMFRSLLAYWQHKNRYYPGEK